MRVIVWMVIFAFVSVRPTVAFADASYKTFTLDSTGKILETQSSYVPTGVVDGSDIPGNTQLSSPQDIFIDATDAVYVADTGNSRVVVFDKYGRYIRSVGSTVLSQPTGVYVDHNGYLFVADSGNNAVYKFDQSGRLVHTYSKPTSVLYGANTPFVPEKVVTDHEGNLFIVNAGSVQGLIELSPQGDYEGYFGGNRSGFSLLRYFERMFYTKTQLLQLQTILPSSPTNVAIDDQGLIYTVTSGLESQVIKKLNVSGDNLLPPDMPNLSNTTAVTVDHMGDIYAVDATYGWVTEYDADGRVLSIFGGSDTGSQRLGLFKSPSGIAVSSDGRVFVLDKERGNIQIFRPTGFTLLEHKAISLYLDGKYVESIQPWEQVLRLNSILGIAHVGIGMADYKKGDYVASLQQFRLAKDKSDYSNAYWEIRREWLLKNLSKVLLALEGLFIGRIIVRRLYHRFGFGRTVVSLWAQFKGVRLIAELWHVFRVMRHPIDGFYELRMEGKVSTFSATILLVLYFLIHLFTVLTTNFLFTNINTSSVSLTTETYSVFIPVFAWIVSNYLVSTINDGEGRFRDVYRGTLYALSPYIVFAAPIAVMSLAMTNMELVLYTFARDGMVLWSALLMFFMLKEVHGYELGETFRNIFVTIIGMMVMAILAFILFGLSNQVIDFVHSVSQEVIIRVFH